MEKKENILLSIKPEMTVASTRVRTCKSSFKNSMCFFCQFSLVPNSDTVTVQCSLTLNVCFCQPTCFEVEHNGGRVRFCLLLVGEKYRLSNKCMSCKKREALCQAGMCLENNRIKMEGGKW